MASNTIIVFGPTGGVGSIVAITAQQHGCKVWLAMRDPSKAIPGLDQTEEKHKGFERVEADLTKPETVKAAAQKSGAKRAFMYLAHSSKDHMKATIEGMKAGGIEFIVFLSSYSITTAPALVQPGNLIAFIHASVELQLEAIYGSRGYVALRPGAFASNAVSWFASGIKSGEVKLQDPNLQCDWITAEDMGAVAGAVLANGQKDGEKIVYLYGPEFLSFKEACAVIKQEAGTRDFEIKRVSTAEAAASFEERGMPAPFAKFITDKFAKWSAGDLGGEFQNLKEGQANVVRYAGRPGTTLQTWVSKNKEKFV